MRRTSQGGGDFGGLASAVGLGGGLQTVERDTSKGGSLSEWGEVAPPAPWKKDWVVVGLEESVEATGIIHAIGGLEPGFLLPGGGSCLQRCFRHKTGMIWGLPGEGRRKEVES